MGQLGNEGFFGPWGVDANPDLSFLPTLGSNNLNFWAGYTNLDTTSWRDLATTHSTEWQSLWMEYEAEVRVNPAIRAWSIMRIGSWRTPEEFLPTTPARQFAPNSAINENGNGLWGAFQTPNLENTVVPNALLNGGTRLPFRVLGAPPNQQIQQYKTFADGASLPNNINSEYQNSWFGGTKVAFSPVYVQSLWVTWQVPWGTLVFGKRPAPFGMGLILDGSETSTETLALIAPYGPFRIGLYGSAWQQGYALSGLYGDWYNPYDSGNKRIPRLGGFFTYENGPLVIGALIDYSYWHRDPGGALGATFAGPAPTPDFQFRQQDTVDYFWTVYMNYNNGRFFFNGEIAHYDRKRTARGNLDATHGPPLEQFFSANSDQAPWYIEDWRYAFETGCFLGPAKISIFGAWFSGPDRRARVYIDRSPMQFGNGVLLGCQQVFEPYSRLMVLGYGTGAGSFNYYTHRGNYVDARSLAARVDYAVAANLNTYFSAFYAERNSHGYGWGWIFPEFNWNAGVAPIAFLPAGRTSTLNPWDQPLVGQLLGGSPGTQFNWSNVDGTPAPSIPSADLGWELGAGWQWKLLEGATFTGDCSIWWPGSWFSYACVSRANPGWVAGTHTATNQYGTRPGRSIDPIYGWSIKLLTTF